MRCEGSAQIDIGLGGTVPILQLLPIEGQDLEKAAGEASAKGGELAGAAAKGDAGTVSELAVGLDVDSARDALGRTALHRASVGKHQAAVEALLQAKAQPECVTDDGTTALMLAAQVGAIDVCEALMTAGASPNPRDDHGATAAQIATEEGHPECAAACTGSGEDSGKGVGPQGDRLLKVNFALGIEHQPGPTTAQKVVIDLSAPQGPGTEMVSLEAFAGELGVALPEGCKSMVVADFLAADELDEAGAGVLQGMVEMIIDGSLAENELFLNFEAGLRDVEGRRVYRLSLFFNADWHATAVQAQAPLKTLQKISAKIELDRSLLELLEAQEAGTEDPSLPEHVRCCVASLGVDESLLSGEMLAQLPKPVPEWILEKIDTEFPPLQHAEAEVNINFDGKILLAIMEDTGKMGMAKISALREAAKGAPIELPPEFGQMIKGLVKLNVVAEGGATVNMDFGGAMPVFQLLPCVEGGGEGGEDDDSDWE